MKSKPAAIEFSPYWEPRALPWWKRFFLLFKRTRVSIDLGHGRDYGVICFYKKLGGKPHVISWKMLTEDDIYRESAEAMAQAAKDWGVWLSRYKWVKGEDGVIRFLETKERGGE